MLTLLKMTNIILILETHITMWFLPSVCACVLNTVYSFDRGFVGHNCIRKKETIYLEIKQLKSFFFFK